MMSSKSAMVFDTISWNHGRQLQEENSNIANCLFPHGGMVSVTSASHARYTLAGPCLQWQLFWHVARKKSCVHDGYVLKHRTMWRDLEIKGPKRLDRVVGPKWFGVYIRSVSGPKRLVAWAEMGPNVFDLPNFTFLWATCAVGFESVRLDFSALTGMDHYCCLLRVCLYVQDCQSPGHRSLPL